MCVCECWVCTTSATTIIVNIYTINIATSQSRAYIDTQLISIKDKHVREQWTDRPRTQTRVCVRTTKTVIDVFDGRAPATLIKPHQFRIV